MNNTKLFLSVVWDTYDISSQASVNPNIKWRDINWKRVEKYVFKSQKLIYIGSSRGDIPSVHNYQKLLSKSYYARFLVIRGVTQDNQGKKTAGIDGIKNLPLMPRFNLVYLLKSRFMKASPTCKVTDSKTKTKRNMPIRHTNNIW